MPVWRMPLWRISQDIWGWRATTLVMMAVASAHATVLVLDPGSRSIAGAAAASEVIVFAVVLAAALVTYVQWRISGDTVAAWMTVALVTIAGPNLALAAAAMSHPDGARSNPIGSMLVQVLITVALLVVALVSTRWASFGDPLATGVASGLILSLATTALATGPLPESLSPAARTVLGLLPVLGALALAHLLLTRTELPAWGRLRLSLAAVLLAVAQLDSYAPGSNPAADTLQIVTLIALVTGAGLLCCTALALVRRSLWESHHTMEALHDRLTRAEATVRLDAARLHEIGATVAGIASASRLINDPPVQLPVQRRTQLGELLVQEVARLERLMRRDVAGQVVLDLDDTIRRLAIRQQIQGHPVHWTRTGQRVKGCPDDVTEVLSILLDNAAKHGLRAPTTLGVTAFDGVVEIAVTDTGPGISPEVHAQLFDWGARGPDSPGQGIGLNIARDLAEKQGGYLMLADSPRPGATFVLGLLSGESNDAVGYIAG